MYIYLLRFFNAPFRIHCLCCTLFLSVSTSISLIHRLMHPSWLSHSNISLILSLDSSPSHVQCHMRLSRDGARTVNPTRVMTTEFKLHYDTRFELTYCSVTTAMVPTRGSTSTVTQQLTSNLNMVNHGLRNGSHSSISTECISSCGQQADYESEKDANYYHQALAK